MTTFLGAPAVHLIELTNIGDELGVVLPEATLVRLQLRAGDTVYLTEDQDSLVLSVNEPKTPSGQAQAGDPEEF